MIGILSKKIDLSLLKDNNTVTFRNGGKATVKTVTKASSNNNYTVAWKDTTSASYSYLSDGSYSGGGNNNMLDIISFERLPDDLDRANDAFQAADLKQAVELIIKHLRPTI